VGTFETPDWAEIDLAKDLESGEDVGNVDVTSRSAARTGHMKISAYGLGEFLVSFDALIPAAGETNDAYDALMDAQEAREGVDILIVRGGAINEDNLPAKRAICIVGGGRETEPVEGSSSVKFELRPMNNSDLPVPVKGTVVSSEFVQAGS
jgi:hypothetical protein